MKRLAITAAALSIMALASVGGVLASASQASAATVSDKVAAGMQQMREEKKLARDVYPVFDEQYGGRLAIFGNIARSEDRHILAVKRLLARYRVTDPINIDVPGVFQDPELEHLYDELVAQGSVSLRDAIEVGIVIEKLDISDLKTLRAQTSRVAVKRVYTNLVDGSYKHLAGFNRAFAIFGD